MKLLAKLFLFFAKIRYAIEVKGMDNIDKNTSYLVLPNHISFLEPMIIWSLFSLQIKLRPVATTAFAKHRLLKRFFDLIGTIGIQENDRNDDPNKLTQSWSGSLDKIKSSLEGGDSLLLYPSGQLAGQGLEYL